MVHELEGFYQDDEEPDTTTKSLLKYGPRTLEELDRTVYDFPISDDCPAQLANDTYYPVEGSWSGCPPSPDDGYGIIQLNLISDSENTSLLRGSGVDSHGAFEVSGNVDRNHSFQITLRRQGVAIPSDPCIFSYITGEILTTTCYLNIRYGPYPHRIDRQMILYPGSANLVRFRLSSSAIRPHHSAEEDPNVRSQAQDRWSFACLAVLAQVKRKMWAWSYFKNRRHHRHRYVALYRQRYMFNSPDELITSQLDAYAKALSPLDIRFYRSLARSPYFVCHHTCACHYFLLCHTYFRGIEMRSVRAAKNP
jgi:hypothetical protein